MSHFARPRRLFALAAIAAFSLAAPTAAASVGDVFGFGSRAAGLAGAATALADGFEATYYNPARVGGPARFSLGFLGGASLLDVNGARQKLEDPVGLVIGASATIPFGGVLRDRIDAGVGFFLLPDKIVRAIARPPTAAFFPLYDNRTQRVMVLPALAFKLSPRISIGIGANVLAALGGTIDVRDGPQRALDARVSEDLKTTFALNAGVTLRPHDRWTIALSIRDEFALPFFADATTSLSGTRLILNLSASTLFEPTTVTLGNAVELAPGLRVALDIAYKRWSRYRGGFVEVDGVLPIPIGSVGEVALAPVLPVVQFKDVVALRVGAEGVAMKGGSYSLEWRGGYAFEPSPVPRQNGVTNLVDGEKHLFSAGLSVVHQRFRVDVHFAAQIVGGMRADKPAESAFPVLEGGGVMLSGGLVGSYYFQ